MLKSIIKSLLIAMLVVSPVFADEELSVFNKKGGVIYPKPNKEESFFAPAAPRASSTQGYIGMNIGPGLTRIKPEITKDGISVIDANNKKKNAINYGAGIYGGVGTNFNHFYIGSEMSLALNILNKNIIPANNTIKMSIKQPIVVGLDIIPGYLTQARDMLFYGRLGVGSSLFNLGLTDTSNNVDNTTSKINFGIRAGFGVEFFMTDSFSLRTEYVYAKYRDISDACSSNPDGSGKPYTYKLSGPGVHQVNFGLAMRF